MERELRRRLLFTLLITFACASQINAQITFIEDCFVGGVTVSGAGNRGVNPAVEAAVRWEPTFTTRAVYAVTYRWGHIAPHSMYVNGGEVHWNLSSQVGPETPVSNPGSHPFAVHVLDVTETVEINDSVLSINFPPQQFYSNAWNWGWWPIYLVILYEAPHIDEEVCFRLYTADQRQDMMQNYPLILPNYDNQKDLLLSTFGANIAQFSNSGSTIWFNGDTLGEVVGYDLTNPPTFGVQGHFFYENSSAQGLNGDTVNGRFFMHDAITALNERIIENQPQLLQIKQSHPSIYDGDNPHPAFTLVYTPSCPVISSDAMPRSYTLCRGDSVQLQGIEGFDHYDWSPGLQLDDSTAMATTCTPDSSRWYRLRMWNEDATQGCPLTIPVWVKVGQTPRPGNLAVVQSSCPVRAGAIRFEEMAGAAPYTFTVGTKQQESPLNNFINMNPGTYPLQVIDANGCSWDSTATIALNTPHNAAFTANPTEGVSPLQVLLSNQSSGANAFLWLLDGEPFSIGFNTAISLPDSGTYEISLVAIKDTSYCADTTTVLVRVRQGIEMIVPNIFTPNGDGANDRLVAQLLGVRRLHWQVHNRWGTLLHSGEATTVEDALTALELWDGQTAAGPASDGSYLLSLIAEGSKGRTESLQVAVQLAGSYRQAGP
jgi:hypothetical protein